NGAQHQLTADQCCYKCFHLILVGSSSIIIRDSELIYSCEMCRYCVSELRGHGKTLLRQRSAWAGVPCKGRTPGRKQSNGRGPSWTGVCPCCYRQKMPALTDRRYSAACSNHRRLTGKILHSGHFPMKILGFSLASCSSVSLQESRLRCVCDRGTSKGSRITRSFPGFLRRAVAGNRRGRSRRRCWPKCD